MPVPSGIPTESIENDPIQGYRGREIRETGQLLDEALEGLFVRPRPGTTD